MNDKYKYVVAISFAEENRDAAHHLADLLTREGITNYYYPEHLIEDVGWDLEKLLTAKYSKESQYAVALLSEKYFKKPFTRIELSAIRNRMLENEDHVYLIPVLMDGYDLSNHPYLARITHLQWNHAPETVVAAVCRILGKQIGPSASKEVLRESQLASEHIKKGTSGTINILKQFHVTGTFNFIQHFGNNKSIDHDR